MSVNTASLLSNDLQVPPSLFCRFCQKNLICTGAKVPKVSLFSVLKTRDLVGFSGAERLILADMARE